MNQERMNGVEGEGNSPLKFPRQRNGGPEGFHREIKKGERNLPPVHASGRPRISNLPIESDRGGID